MTTLGDLRHRVQLLGLEEAAGEGGEKTRTFPVIAAVWAEVTPSALPVRTTADRLEYATSYTITVPYSDGYLAARRIAMGSRTFEVHSILNLAEERRFLVFQGEEM
ncbi:MAG TPA: head-tail adaptor protein [Sphingomonadales bacterium]|nr:head-tail adaptor protein [Sphingomonadales bacterium]